MSTVLAYLDPGSGGMILQALLGGVAGLFVAMRMFGERVKSVLFFWRKDDAEGTAPKPAPEPEA